MRDRNLSRQTHSWLPCRLGLIGMILGGAALSASSDVPIGVSPGGETAMSEVESRCPTFSWGGAAETSQWELVVYRLEEESKLSDEVSEEPRQVLLVELPGTARAWTPAVGSCLEPGARYAWSVRGAGKEIESSWSEPRLFRVVAAPTMAEVREAMAVLQAYLGAESPAILRR